MKYQCFSQFLFDLDHLTPPMNHLTPETLYSADQSTHRNKIPEAKNSILAFKYIRKCNKFF